MQTAPLVTAYIPVYNGARYLREALDSIAVQTFTDWECIVVDDASTDGSAEILASLTDPRFCVVRQVVNQNVANASNLALRLARGKYLARLDQDDVATPDRFEQQVAFMESHPDVDACGGAMLIFGDIENAGYFPPQDDAGIKANLIVGSNNIVNPTATTRIRSMREKRILSDPRFPLSCDYGMWVDLMLAGGRMANLADFMGRYRFHSGQSSKNMDELTLGVIEARTRLLLAWFPDLTYEQVKAAEPILRINGDVPLSEAQARAGLEVCGIMSDLARTTVHGEDRAAVRGHLAARMEAWHRRLEAPQ